MPTRRVSLIALGNAQGQGMPPAYIMMRKCHMQPYLESCQHLKQSATLLKKDSHMMDEEV